MYNTRTPRVQVEGGSLERHAFKWKVIVLGDEQSADLPRQWGRAAGAGGMGCGVPATGCLYLVWSNLPAFVARFRSGSCVLALQQ